MARVKMGKKEKTCETRIDEELTDRIKDFEGALSREKWPDEGGNEDFIEWLNSNFLAYSDDIHYRAKRLELSWGGPQDYFLFFTEEDRIEYHFLDWLDRAVRTLDGEDYNTMKRVYDEYLNI
jgi:hypothetical protein